MQLQGDKLREEYPLPEDVAKEAARTWFAVGMVVATAMFVAYLTMIVGRP